ncbi:surface carbohydrate biosynthesis protein [Vineibacter terrae]|uniref:surface carbohydrate biosynthesis protein n=1 Tax=Vineibacter terrae TaxID=2586908 RepID=UPI002E33DA06|nr:surface carbohydrate biosynthesis protein [Vineibacter terrae]HEX2890169.1 surface carbohydrate biosynthesis protein [Vineibacter terrae]
MKSNGSVILPSETQSREFDGKLLLACYLAERGLETYVGSRVDIHMRIASLPRSVYIAKDFRVSSARMFDILQGLGNPIMAWDEEAILFYNAREFHERRVHPGTFERVEAFFAWGPQNKEFIATAPAYHGAPIHDTGNPRIDLMRPELRAFFDPEVEALRARFGRFILINTNFGKLNHFVGKYTVRPGGRDASVGGVITPFMEGAWQHRYGIFQAFQEMLPRLASVFPDLQIIVRPHPSENHDTWRQAAGGMSNIHVLHEGNVYGWLRGCVAMIHNGCTTGLEGFLLDAPVVSYRPLVSEEYDLHLANDVSWEAYDFDSLVATVRELADGRRRSLQDRSRLDVAGKFLSALDGPLAAERIADHVTAFTAPALSRPLPTAAERVRARARAAWRASKKRINALRPGHKNSRAYNRHRFPGIAVPEVETRIRRFGQLLGRFDGVIVEPVSQNIFRVRQRPPIT